MTPKYSYTVGAALMWSQRQLGHLLQQNESNPTILNTATQIVPNNADRLVLVVMNVSASNVTVALNAGVTTTNGIIIVANTGALIVEVRDDFTLPSFAWWVISAGASSVIYVLELIASVELPGVPGT